MENTLLPCPFCGSKATLVSEDCGLTVRSNYCECSDCEAKTASYTHTGEAIYSWNVRVVLEDPAL